MSTRVKKPLPGRPPGASSFDSETAEVVGEVVRQLRLAAGISQETLAHMADVERSYCGRIERGESQPTLYVVLKLASALSMEGHALVKVIEGRLAKVKRRSTTKSVGRGSGLA